MYQSLILDILFVVSIFQFPLLGIFRCTPKNHKSKHHTISFLSIPVTWDFPLHLVIDATGLSAYGQLSIPVTWDFPLHQASILFLRKELIRSFNSRYLGFSVAPMQYFVCASLLIFRFQFPLLGIFRCTFFTKKKLGSG